MSTALPRAAIAVMMISLEQDAGRQVQPFHRLIEHEKIRLRKQGLRRARRWTMPLLKRAIGSWARSASPTRSSRAGTRLRS